MSWFHLRPGVVRALAVTGGAALVAVAALPTEAADNGNNNTSRKLRAAVSADGMLDHLEALQKIADANGGNRVSGRPGYDASKDYAVDVLENAGYDVTVQPFDFQTFIVTGPTSLRQVAPPPERDLPHVPMSYTGAGAATALAVVPNGVTAPEPAVPPNPPVTAPLNQGCQAANWAPGTLTGKIALVSRGTCPFAQKATVAEAAGAVGIVIYNNAAGTLSGTLGATFTGNIPAVGVTQALGNELVALVPQGLTLSIDTTQTFRGEATGYNVLAESRWGDPENVVMAGAHLDSVNAGPGINDNGTGSAAILEIADQMQKVHPTNKVRFALWGAEESGLVGSRHYVAGLSEAERQRIALYLNFDMIGSPNYVRFVYDGDNSAFPVGPGAAEGPAGSGAIEKLFHDYFASVGLASAETAFSGRSDYGPFIADGVGIPSGGLFTGAEGTKTAEQAAVYGGVAGQAYDPCYHQACDSLTYNFAADPARAATYAELDRQFRMAGNVNLDALEEMGDAVAHAVITYAFDTRSVNGEGKGNPVSPPGQSGSGAGEGSTTDSGGGLHDDHDHEVAA